MADYIATYRDAEHLRSRQEGCHPRLLLITSNSSGPCVWIEPRYFKEIRDGYVTI